MKTKTCILCHQVKPMDLFPKADTNTDGHDNRCRTCRNELAKHYKARRKQGLTQPANRMKHPRDVHIEPFDPELETKRHLQNLIGQYGHEDAVIKIKLERFAT